MVIECPAHKRSRVLTPPMSKSYPLEQDTLTTLSTTCVLVNTHEAVAPLRPNITQLVVGC